MLHKKEWQIRTKKMNKLHFSLENQVYDMNERWILMLQQRKKKNTAKDIKWHVKIITFFTFTTLDWLTPYHNVQFRRQCGLKMV